MVHAPKVSRRKRQCTNPASAKRASISSPCTRQVGVGMSVVRDNASHKGDDGIGIELIELAEWEMHRRRELYDTKYAAGSKYPVHLGKALRQMLEIAYAIGYGDGIEAIVGEAEVQAVAGLEIDMAGIATRRSLLPRHIEHAFREVYTRKLGRMQHIVDEKGHVARTGRHIEHARRVVFAHHTDSFAPPPAVDAESHHTIHQVVCRSYRVEHVAHLPGLGSRAVVGFYIFGFEAAHCHACFRDPDRRAARQSVEGLSIKPAMGIHAYRGL